MLPLLPFYGIRLQYPLSDPGCADGEKLRDGVVEMIASNPEAGNEIGGAGGARKVRIAGRGKGKSDTPTPGPGRMQIRPVTSVFWSASLGVHSNRTGGCRYECGCISHERPLFDTSNRPSVNRIERSRIDGTKTLVIIVAQ